MKTVYGCLPFYDSIVKQDFNRIKSILPILCPSNQLPSFQIALGSTAIASADRSIVAENFVLINKDYDGTEEAVATDWVSDTFDTTFNHSGLSITEGKNVGSACIANTDSFVVEKGDMIHVQGIMSGSTGIYPRLWFSNDYGGGPYIDPQDGTVDLTLIVRTAGSTSIRMDVVGAIDFSFTGLTITIIKNQKSLYWYLSEMPSYYTPTDTSLSPYVKYNGPVTSIALPLGIYYLRLTIGVNVYYSDYIAVISMADPMLRFMKLNFSNSKNLGNICYEDGFSQTVWLEAILNNPSHEIVNIGEEKDGIFIAEKITTKFIYSIIAYITRSLYNCLARLPQHDTITITDEVGNTYTPSVGNIIVSPGEWSYFDVCRLTINFNDGEQSSFSWTN
jgi:hypothetical protein